MTLDAKFLQDVIANEPKDAWAKIIEHSVALCSAPVNMATASAEITKRDREIGILDHLLSSSCWDLWNDFEKCVERTSQKLIKWWAEPYEAKAILILDGLSLRELPWILEGAAKHGLKVHSVSASASELPGETNEFARSLGFSSRSQIQNNGAGLAHKLISAKTETVDLPWEDCGNLIDASPNWLFWHQWPDSKLHDGAGAGQGLDQLTRIVADQLTSDAFWNFVSRLAQGRKLIITSDHGYAATGLFFDAPDEESRFLKETLKSGRSKSGKIMSDIDRGSFVPPVALAMNGVHGPHLLALGRWKWRSQGGYPTLAHGGLSLLEVLSPYVEITK